MIPVSIFIFLAVVAGFFALYSVLERESWMYSQITASGLSVATLWVLTAMLAAGNVGDTGVGSPQPVLDPTLTYLFALFSIVSTLYFVLHVANWIQDRIMDHEEDKE